MKIKIVKPNQILPLKGKTVGFDIETSGLELWRDICIVQFYDPEQDTSFIVPVKTKEFCLSESEKEQLAEIISTLKVKGHNLQFDLSMVKYHFGVMPEPVGDTFLMARMMQFKIQALKELAVNFYPELAPKLRNFKDIVDIPKDGSDIEYSIRDKEFMFYCGLDPYLPIIVEKAIKNKSLWSKMENIYQIELEFLREVSISRASGILVDKAVYDDKMEEFKRKNKDLENKFYKLAGQKVNINSHAKLRKLLFEDLGYPITPIKTSKGAPSTSVESLEYLAGDELIDTLLELKHVSSVYSGSKKLPQYLSPESRIHPEILSLGYDGTPRVYSTDPSVNQYPLELREAIIPSPGKKFIYMDWSAAELYVAAFWAGQVDMCQQYENGRDLHRWITAELLNRKEEDITEQDREVSKVVSFSTIYGSEGDAVARALKISRSEGEDLVNRYLSRFSKIKELRDRIQERCRNTTYTETYFGRPRRLPHIKSSDAQDVKKAERQAFNSAIQGSVADCMKKAVIKSAKYPELEYKFGVFDSLLFEVDENMTPDVYLPMLADLSDFGDFRLRFKYSEGKNWRECQEKA